MSRRLLRLGVRVHPEKAMFRIHDRGADPTGMQAPALPQGDLVSVGYDQMWIGSLQDDVEVTVLLEEWDGEPPRGRTTWEHEVVEELYLRGAVAVSTTTAEPVLHGVRLLGGVGRYQARIRAQHRAEIARLYDALLDRFRDGFSREFQAALQQLEGVEHYLVQLWPSPSSSGPQRIVSDAVLAISGGLPEPPPQRPLDQTGPLPSLPEELLVTPPPPPAEPAEPAEAQEADDPGGSKDPEEPKDAEEAKEPEEPEEPEESQEPEEPGTQDPPLSD